jgi:hypothetical protein
MSTPRRAGHTAHRTDPTRAARLHRDAGTERGRSITKGIAFGSVAAVAVAGVYLSQALPGHSASPASSTSGAAGAATPVSSGAGTSSGSGASYAAPSAPAYTPAPAYNQAPVVSSGSS